MPNRWKSNKTVAAPRLQPEKSKLTAVPQRPFVSYTLPDLGKVTPKSHKTGAPGRIRTYDLKLRRLVLYPTELRARARQS